MSFAKSAKGAVRTFDTCIGFPHPESRVLVSRRSTNDLSHRLHNQGFTEWVSGKSKIAVTMNLREERRHIHPIVRQPVQQLRPTKETVSIATTAPFASLFKVTIKTAIVRG
jgi:hypothetical protein